MFLKNWLKKSLFRGILKFLPVALLASGADAAVLWGIRAFMDILSGEGPMPLYGWVGLMLCLTFLRLIFLTLKIRVSESWVFAAGARIMGWFLHRLRLLHPRNFHTPAGNLLVESAYESTLVLQNNGAVLFQGAQAVLQLAVFLPVLLYISWPLTLFLFAVVVPVVGALQRKLHKLGPVEENLLRDRSRFRGDLTLARRLFLQWSSRRERTLLSDELLQQNRHLRNDGLAAGLRKNGLSLVAESVSVVAMVLVLGFCAVLIRCGWMNGSGLVLFCSAVLLSYKPVKECARVLPQFRSAVSALKILEEFEKAEIRSSDFGGRGAGSANGYGPDGLFVKNGSFKYAGSERPVFAGLNLEWSRSKPVLVRGKNGIGKSTLLRLLAGLESWDAEGAADGICSSLPVAANAVFFVAQDLELPPRRLLRGILESLKRGCADSVGVAAAEGSSATAAGCGFSVAGCRELFAFAENFGILPLVEKQGLSGGERSRVALLWALASDCDTVLLDEPFASIALADREPLLAAFLQAAAALDKWVVIVSHDVLSPEMEGRFSIVNFDGAGER